MFVAGPDGELGSHSRRAICGGWARALQVAHIPKHIFQILFVWAGQGPYFPNIFAHIPKHMCKTWFVWALLMFYTYWAHSPRYLQNLVWLGAFKKRYLFYTYWAQSPRVCIGVCFFKHMSKGALLKSFFDAVGWVGRGVKFVFLKKNWGKFFFST